MIMKRGSVGLNYSIFEKFYALSEMIELPFPPKRKDVQHIAFPRGPPPQYYRYSRQLNFAVRMGSGDPA